MTQRMTDERLNELRDISEAEPFAPTASVRAHAMRELIEEVDRLRAEQAQLAWVIQDLREVAREVEGEPGGMGVPWLHELTSASRLPSFVTWARRAVRAVDGA